MVPSMTKCLPSIVEPSKLPPGGSVLIGWVVALWGLSRIRTRRRGRIPRPLPRAFRDEVHLALDVVLCPRFGVAGAAIAAVAASSISLAFMVARLRSRRLWRCLGVHRGGIAILAVRGDTGGTRAAV